MKDDPVMTTHCGHALCAKCFEHIHQEQHRQAFSTLTQRHIQCPSCNKSTAAFPIIEPIPAQAARESSTEPKLPNSKLSLVTAHRWATEIKLSLGEGAWINTDVFKFNISGNSDAATGKGGYFDEKETALLPNSASAAIQTVAVGGGSAKPPPTKVAVRKIKGGFFASSSYTYRVPAAKEKFDFALHLTCCPTNCPTNMVGGYVVNVHRLALKVKGHADDTITVQLIDSEVAKGEAFKAFFKCTSAESIPHPTEGAHTYFAPKKTGADHTMVEDARLYYVASTEKLIEWADLHKAVQSAAESELQAAQNALDQCFGLSNGPLAASIKEVEYPTLILRREVRLYPKAAEGNLNRKGIPTKHLPENLRQHLDFWCDPQCAAPARITKAVSITAEVLEGNSMNRVLLCCRYPGTMGAIQRALIENFYEAGRNKKILAVASAGTPEERGKKFLEFQNQDEVGAHVTLLMESTGNCDGINLFRANHLILVDASTSKEVEEQLIGRLYRIGQAQCGITIHRIVVNGTVEQRLRTHWGDENNDSNDGDISQRIRRAALLIRDAAEA